MTRHGFSKLLAIFFVMAPAVALAGTRSNDPRCAGFTCSLDAGTSFSSIYAVDPTTCPNATNCPQCLSGPVWASRIKDMASYVANRALQPYIQIDNWLSANLVQTISTILLREVLGFVPVDVAINLRGNIEHICCTQPLVSLERWPTGLNPSDDGFFTLSVLPIGYEGTSALFVPEYVTERYPLATAFSAYKYLTEYDHIFPRGMSTDCNLLLVDPSKGCVDGNYVCDTNAWTNTTCVRGRYVPPQCSADPTSCQEIYLADPTWDEARFESIVKNNGLKFVIAYLGANGLPTFVQQQAALKRNFMFYWWQPDPLPSSVDAQTITFKPHTLGCEQQYVASKGDPTLSAVACAYPSAILTKAARRDTLSQDVQFKHFFDSASFSDADMGNMMSQHLSAGGNKSVYEVSCDWVHTNFDTWQAWILPAQASAAAQASQSSKSGELAAIIVSVIGAAAIAAGFAFLRISRAAAVRNAPKKTPFALIFTDVESSTKLWERYGDDMGKAMAIHHDVLRQTIKEYHGYEVKTIGDSFMIACTSLVDAVELCVVVQERLYAASWPPSIQYWKNADGDGATDSPSFAGLNVRMGVHWCLDAEPQVDTVSGRYDYYGHDVNISARVESAAFGGQILMTFETSQTLHLDPTFEERLGEARCVVRHVSKSFELKGIADPVSMYSIVPRSLAARVFPALPGAPTGDGLDAGDGEGFSASGMQSGGSSKLHDSASSISECDADPTANMFSAAVHAVFGALETDTKLRDQLLATLCRKVGVIPTGRLERRIATVAHAMRRETLAAFGVGGGAEFAATPESRSRVATSTPRVVSHWPPGTVQ